MPNSKSAKKRLRQDEARRIHNRSKKTAVKTQLKKVLTAAEAGDIETAEKEYIVAQKKLDRAGADRIMHPNAAARQKSRLQRAILKAKNATK